MPSVSKKQQKFMGIVRSIQKGEQPASKFSKSAQDAAKKMKKSSVKKYAKTDHDDLPKKVKEERDYKDEYKKFQSSTKSKKYRAELNKYNRKKGTYGNGDGKDASHKGGKIVGFESQSKNRGRAEKSRVKKESIPDFTPIIDEALDGLITEGARDPGIFKAIFLAGGPGSGKSYVAQNLFGIPEKVNVSKTGLKMVNQDAELELLLKKYFGTTDIDNMPDELFADLTGVDKAGQPVDYDTSGLRKYAKSLSKERLRLYTEGKLGVIIDGTGHNFNKLKARRKKLIDLGYDTFMVFVNTSLDVALKRNQERDRVVPEEIVKDSWQEVQDNMGGFQGLFGNANFMIVQNNKHLSKAQSHKHFKMLVEKGIDKFLKKPIKSKIGKAWMRREKKNQKVFKDPGQSKFFEHVETRQLDENTSAMMKIYKDLDSKFKNYDVNKIRDFNKVDSYLKTKFNKNSALPDTISSFYQDYKSGEDMKKNINNLVKYAKKMKEGVNESEKAYAKSLRKIANDRKLKMMSKKDKETLIKLAKMMAKANESVTEGLLKEDIQDLKKIVKELEGASKMHLGQSKRIQAHLDDMDVKEQSVKEAVEMSKGVQKLMKIADEGYGKVGGTTVDSMSASLFKQLYDRANDDIKEKLNKKNERQLVMIIGRMWKKFGKNVKIGSSL